MLASSKLTGWVLREAAAQTMKPGQVVWDGCSAKWSFSRTSMRKDLQGVADGGGSGARRREEGDGAKEGRSR